MGTSSVFAFVPLISHFSSLYCSGRCRYRTDRHYRLGSARVAILNFVRLPFSLADTHIHRGTRTSSKRMLGAICERTAADEKA
uniref:Putative secreted protein n=1 Tax=Anopheles marajoara TaxID=58244 RepID=A0A2M4CB13_9DIPT